MHNRDHSRDDENFSGRYRGRGGYGNDYGNGGSARRDEADDDRYERRDFRRGEESGFSAAANRYATEHDADYARWRQSQIDQLDQDYMSWQEERRKKFSDEFEKWRNDRKSKGQSASDQKK